MLSCEEELTELHEKVDTVRGTTLGDAGGAELPVLSGSGRGETRIMSFAETMHASANGTPRSDACNETRAKTVIVSGPSLISPHTAEDDASLRERGRTLIMKVERCKGTPAASDRLSPETNQRSQLSPENPEQFSQSDVREADPMPELITAIGSTRGHTVVLSLEHRGSTPIAPLDNALPSGLDNVQRNVGANASDPPMAPSLSQVTRIVKPKEWLPPNCSESLNVVPLINAAHAGTEETRNVGDGAPASEKNGYERSASKAPRPILSQAQALPWTRKVMLALSPFALVAGFYPHLHARDTARQATRVPSALPTPAVHSTTAVPQQNAAPTVEVYPVGTVATQPPRTAEQKTLLREAVDALAEGDFVRARQHYQALSLAEPGNFAYRAAVKAIDLRLSTAR